MGAALPLRGDFDAADCVEANGRMRSAGTDWREAGSRRCLEACRVSAPPGFRPHARRGHEATGQRKSGPRSVWWATARSISSCGIESKNALISRSITQSNCQHLFRAAPTASSAERPIAVGTRVEYGFHFRFQDHLDNRLRHPDGRNAERPFATPRLGDLDEPHRRRMIRSRRHPVPDLVKVALQILLEGRQLYAINSRRSTFARTCR